MVKMNFNMNSKKLILGTLISTIVLFVMGFFSFGFLLTDFFAAHYAPGYVKEAPDMIHLFIGHLAGGLLLCIIFIKWAEIKSFNSGAKAGSILGFLFALMIDLILFSTTNSADITATLIDPIVVGINWAVGGGVLGWFLGKSGS
jgi:hypothetical protein